MEKPTNLRDRLLEQHVPEPSRLATYREEVRVMLEKNQRNLRRQAIFASVMWVFIVLTTTAYLVISGFSNPPPERGWMIGLATCAVVMLGGAVELVKLFVNSSRVELLKELKRLELEILELKEAVKAPRPA